VAQVLIVGLGGFVGAVLRYGLSGLVHRYTSSGFPFGTLLVNVVGCLAIGAVMSLVECRQLFAPNTRLFLTIGLLGSLTTFSTLGYETFELLRDKELYLALSNVGMNFFVGMAAVMAGWVAAKAIAT